MLFHFQWWIKESHPCPLNDQWLPSTPGSSTLFKHLRLSRNNNDDNKDNADNKANGDNVDNEDKRDNEDNEDSADNDIERTP